MFMAADNGHTEVVGLLIDSGADKCKARRHDEATPLYIAAQKGHWQVVQLLVQAEVEINKATTEGATPLHTAVENAHRDVVHVLIMAGADRNTARMRDGATPLYIAAQRGHLQLFSCSSRLGLRSTKPRLTKEQRHCTLQLSVRIGKLFIF